MAHLVGVVEDSGSELRVLSRTFEVTATGGEFGIPDLNAAKAWLLNLRLAEEQSGYFVLADALTGVESLGDETVRLVILREAVDQVLSSPSTVDVDGVLGEIRKAAAQDPVFAGASLFAEERVDLARRVLVGEIGEEVVLSSVREELTGLNRPDLAANARRVSLESDRFGYDVLAPRLGDFADRLLEVKASTTVTEVVRFYLTRNESKVGRTEKAWRLVVCEVTNLDERAGSVVGWCTSGELASNLPTDNGAGRWEQVQISLRVADLRPGLPPAVV